MKKIKAAIIAFFVLYCCSSLLVFAQNGTRYPGSSIASALLQKDVTPSVFAAMASISPTANCRQFSVLNTALTHRLESPAANKAGILIEGIWEEQWHVKLCQREALVPITFIPDGKGGTSYTIHPQYIHMLKK